MPGFTLAIAASTTATGSAEYFTGLQGAARILTRRGKYIGINSYAATSPAEFFAVLSETFFEKPEILAQRFTELYKQMQEEVALTAEYCG